MTAKMAPWETEKEHVMRRMDRFDARFDKLDTIIAKQGEQAGEQIDALRVEVSKIASNMYAFKSEFRIKTSAWAFLGTALAILIGMAVYVIKMKLS